MPSLLVGRAKNDPNFETRDQDIVWVRKRRPKRQHVRRLIDHGHAVFHLTGMLVGAAGRQL